MYQYTDRDQSKIKKEDTSKMYINGSCGFSSKKKIYQAKKKIVDCFS